jgi:drug/metabolite transporter (DMT)-like permease
MALRDFALLVFVCGVWASSNILSKIVVSDMNVPPLFYAALRFALVAFLVSPWLLPMPRPRWRLIAVALFMGAGGFALLFVGLKTSTPSAAAVVSQAGAPCTTLLSMALLGERVRWRRGIGIALTLLGVLVVMYDPHGFAVSPGLWFVLAGAIVNSFGAVLMKQMEGVRPLQFQAWVGLASFAPLAILSAMLEPGQMRAGLVAGWPFLAAVVYSALAVSVAAHTLYYGLIQRYEANLVSALTLITPLATIGLGVLITHDRFGARMAIGAAVAIAGVLIIVLRPNQVAALLLGIRTRGP